jgi:tetratricopeptide (TPR) repeat protein
MDARNELLLIQYLDRTLEEGEMREVEALMNTDPEVRKEWQYLQLAVEAVEYAALYDQVAAVKENFRTIQSAEVITTLHTRRNPIRLRTVLQVAAGMLLFLTTTVAYKYFTTGATQAYQQTFIDYTLQTTRGAATFTEIEQAYRNKNWNTVIATFNTIRTSSLTDNKTLFLTGMAHLQLKQYAAASELFERVLANNTQTGDDLFQDEAQFYGAMSNLADNKLQRAIELLQQIRADANHLYHQQASRIGNLDWQILKIKAQRK